MKRPFCDLERHCLSESSREFAYDVIDWHVHVRGTQYGCVDISDRERFLESERRRGDCTLYRLRNRAGEAHVSNETFFCSRSKDRNKSVQQRQNLGHAAAASAVKQHRSARQSKTNKDSSTSLFCCKVASFSTMLDDTGCSLQMLIPVQKPALQIAPKERI
jgi:hypothetical protein